MDDPKAVFPGNLFTNSFADGRGPASRFLGDQPECNSVSLDRWLNRFAAFQTAGVFIKKVV
jgi:hypothetical protein